MLGFKVISFLLVTCTFLFALSINLSANVNIEKIYDDSGNVVKEVYYENESPIYSIQFNYSGNLITKATKYDEKINKTTDDYYFNSGTTYANYANNYTFRNSFTYDGNQLSKITQYDYSINKNVKDYYFKNGATYDNYTNYYATRNTFVYDGNQLSKVTTHDYSISRNVADYYFKAGATYDNYVNYYTTKNEFTYTNGALTKISQYDYSIGRYVTDYYFKAGATYNNYASYYSKKNEFTYSGANKSLYTIKQYDYAVKRYLVVYYFKSGASYSNYASKYSYKLTFTYNSNNTLKDATKYDYDSKQNTVRYVFMANTYFGQNHMNRISETVNLLNSSKVIIPIKSGTVTAVAWYYPPSFGGGWHPGIDLGASNGTPVIAPANGEVLKRGFQNGGYGNYMVTVHQIGSDTYTFIMGHLSRHGTNTKFNQGATIGYVGSTGNSNGPHLHVEVFKHTGQTLATVKSKFNGNDYFGLTYSSNGTCGAGRVCRINPQQFFGLSMGQRFNSTSASGMGIMSIPDEDFYGYDNYLDNVRYLYTSVNFGADAFYDITALNEYKLVIDEIRELEAETEEEAIIKAQLENLFDEKIANLEQIILNLNNSYLTEKDLTINDEILNILYPQTDFD